MSDAMYPPISREIAAKRRELTPVTNRLRRFREAVFAEGALPGYPNCFEKGGPDHEARHKLHGKPDRHQNEAAKLKRFVS